MSSMLGAKKSLTFVGLFLIVIALGGLSMMSFSSHVVTSSLRSQTAASCGSTQKSATQDKANSMCPHSDGVSTYYDTKRKCGEVYNADQCAGIKNVLTHPIDLSQVAAGAVISACAKNKANCSCAQSTGTVAATGKCEAENDCRLNFTVGSDGAACEYANDCSATCVPASTKGKQAYDLLNKQYGSTDQVQKASYAGGDSQSPSGSGTTASDAKSASDANKQSAPTSPVNTQPSTQSKDTGTATANQQNILTQPAPIGPTGQNSQRTGSDAISPSDQIKQAAGISQNPTVPQTLQSQASINPDVLTKQASVSATAPATSPSQTSLQPAAQSAPTPSTGAIASASPRPAANASTYASSNPYAPSFGGISAPTGRASALSAPAPSAPINSTYQTIQGTSASVGNGIASFFTGLVSGIFSSLSSSGGSGGASTREVPIVVQTVPVGQATQRPQIPEQMVARSQAISPQQNSSGLPVQAPIQYEEGTGARPYDRSGASAAILNYAKATGPSADTPPDNAAQAEQLLNGLFDGQTLATNASTIIPSAMPADRSHASSSPASAWLQATTSVSARTLNASGVDVAHAITLLSPGWSAIGSDLKGGWAGGNTLFADAAGLAQAKSNSEFFSAQIDALQQMSEVGLCDQSCQSAIASLQSGLTTTQQRIESLTKAVESNQARTEAIAQLPAPSVQMARAVSRTVSSVQGTEGSFANGLPYKPEIATALVYDNVVQLAYPLVATTTIVANTTPSRPVSVALSATDAPSATSAPEFLSSGNPIGTLIVGVWDLLRSFFLPRPNASSTPLRTCSLFETLFGGCGK